MVRRKNKSIFSFTDRLWMWWMYGISFFGRHVMKDMFGKLMSAHKAKWEAYDWKTDLQIDMFSNPLSFFRTHGLKNATWQNCKKLGMSKKRWKALSAKTVPETRPDSWEDNPKSSVTWYILPVEYLQLRMLKKSKDSSTELPSDITDFIRIVSNCSTEELELKYEIGVVSLPELDSASIACLLCLGWLSKAAYEKNSKLVNSITFFDWGIGSGFYAKFQSILINTNWFADLTLNPDFAQAVRSICTWYRKPHPITGTFSVLDTCAKNYNRGFLDDIICWWLYERFGIEFRHVLPYKANEMRDEMECFFAELELKKNDERVCCHS